MRRKRRDNKQETSPAPHPVARATGSRRAALRVKRQANWPAEGTCTPPSGRWRVQARRQEPAVSLAKAGDVRVEETTDAMLILRRRCPPGVPRLDRSLEVERGTGESAVLAHGTGRVGLSASSQGVYH